MSVTLKTKERTNRPLWEWLSLTVTALTAYRLVPQKPKHYHMKVNRDFSKITENGKLIMVLNFNNMIPVCDAVLRDFGHNRTQGRYE